MTNGDNEQGPTEGTDAEVEVVFGEVIQEKLHTVDKDGLGADYTHKRIWQTIRTLEISSVVGGRENGG